MYQPDAPTVPLTPVGPKAGATSGEPFESILEISNDGRITTGVWECTPGAFPSTRDGYSEFMYFLAGDATITDVDGTPHEIRPGVGMVLTDGWRGAWQIRETVRKVYVSVRSER
jgi:uncharacterized cupin superfamily protein